MEPIGYYAALVLNRLQIKRSLLECADDLDNDDCDGKADAKKLDAAKHEPDEHSRYVDQRLRDIEAFERRYERKT